MEECYITCPDTEKWVKKDAVFFVFCFVFFFPYQLWSILICDKTPFWVFDIAFQIMNDSWRNSMQKFTEFYDN